MKCRGMKCRPPLNSTTLNKLKDESTKILQIIFCFRVSFGGGAAKGIFIGAPRWRMCWVLVIHVCTFSRCCDQRSLYAHEAISTRTESKSVSFMTGVRAKLGPSDKTDNSSSDRLT